MIILGLSNDQHEALRERFEAIAQCSHRFNRSRRGTYTNPATARDWKWFQLGAIADGWQAGRDAESDPPPYGGTD